MLKVLKVSVECVWKVGWHIGPLCIWRPAPQNDDILKSNPILLWGLGEAFIKIFHACKSSSQRGRYFTLFLPTFVWENPEKIHQILWKSNNICIELKTCKVTEYELNLKPPTYALKWILKRSTPTGKPKSGSLVKWCLLDGQNILKDQYMCKPLHSLPSLQLWRLFKRTKKGARCWKQMLKSFVFCFTDGKPRPTDWRLTRLLSANLVMTNTHWQHIKNSTGNLFSN